MARNDRGVRVLTTAVGPSPSKDLFAQQLHSDRSATHAYARIEGSWAAASGEAFEYKPR